MKDISVTEVRADTIALAKLATLLNIPVIASASVPNGPNGPLMPKIHRVAPHAVFVSRKRKNERPRPIEEEITR